MVSPEPANGARASTGAFARAGWLRLRFADAALEADFRRYHLAEFLPRMLFPLYRFSAFGLIHV